MQPEVEQHMNGGWLRQYANYCSPNCCCSLLEVPTALRAVTGRLIMLRACLGHVLPIIQPTFANPLLMEKLMLIMPLQLCRRQSEEVSWHRPLHPSVFGQAWPARNTHKSLHATSSSPPCCPLSRSALHLSGLSQENSNVSLQSWQLFV